MKNVFFSASLFVLMCVPVFGAEDEAKTTDSASTTTTEATTVVAPVGVIPGLWQIDLIPNQEAYQKNANYWSDYRKQLRGKGCQIGDVYLLSDGNARFVFFVRTNAELRALAKYFNGHLSPSSLTPEGETPDASDDRLVRTAVQPVYATLEYDILNAPQGNLDSEFKVFSKQIKESGLVILGLYDGDGKQIQTQNVQNVQLPDSGSIVFKIESPLQAFPLKRLRQSSLATQILLTEPAAQAGQQTVPVRNAPIIQAPAQAQGTPVQRLADPITQQPAQNQGVGGQQGGYPNQNGAEQGADYQGDQNYGTGGAANYQNYGTGGAANYQNYGTGGAANYQNYGTGGAANYQNYGTGGAANYQNYGTGGAANYQNYGTGGAANYQNYGTGGAANYQNYGTGGAANYQNYGTGGAANYQNYGNGAANYSGGVNYGGMRNYSGGRSLYGNSGMYGGGGNRGYMGGYSDGGNYQNFGQGGGLYGQ